MKKYELTSRDEEFLDNTFTYHQPKSDQLPRYQAIRDHAKGFARLIMECIPPGRERSLALTKIQEAVMLGNAGIAIGESDK